MRLPGDPVTVYAGLANMPFRYGPYLGCPNELAYDGVWLDYTTLPGGDRGDYLGATLVHEVRARAGAAVCCANARLRVRGTRG